jgi:hypothetical protein
MTVATSIVGNSRWLAPLVHYATMQRYSSCGKLAQTQSYTKPVKSNQRRKMQKTWYM